jgi:hypothetical protein
MANKPTRRTGPGDQQGQAHNHATGQRQDGHRAAHRKQDLVKMRTASKTDATGWQQHGAGGHKQNGRGGRTSADSKEEQVNAKVISKVGGKEGKDGLATGWQQHGAGRKRQRSRAVSD